MITKTELSTALAPLEIEWPRSGFDADRLELWHGHLRVFTNEQVSGAVNTWIGEGKYFPKVAEIRGIIDRHTPRPSHPAPAPRPRLNDLEKTWRAVQGAYANWITGNAIPSEVPLEKSSLMARDELNQFVQTVLVPKDDSLAAHRAGFGELRRQFESLFGKLPKADGRYSHAWCGCSRCEHEANLRRQLH